MRLRPSVLAPFALPVRYLVLCCLGASCAPTTSPSVSFDVVGPELIQPGQSVQYLTIKHPPSGAKEPAADVRWSSSAPEVLQVSSTGLATGVAGGETELTAEIGGQRATRLVMVLPAGTYRLVGVVTESASAAPVPGALVEARIDASGSTPPIAITTTFGNGQFALYGASAAGHVRVTADGYTPVTERVELTAHGTRNFSVPWNTGNPSFAGSYTLTIEANGGCASAPLPLPPDQRRHTFDAQMTQTGSLVSVSVGSRCVSSFEGAGCRLAGRASSSGATFEVTQGNPVDQWPDLVETVSTAIGDRRGLVFLGKATTNISAAGLSGSMAGEITFHPIIFPFPSSQITGRCGTGLFELTRR